MNRIFPALAVALIAGIGGGSAAQAAVHTIDFSVGIDADGGGTLSYIPAGKSTLDKSNAFNFDGTKLVVDSLGSDDNSSGLVAGNPISLMPSLIDYGTGSGTLPAGTLIGNGPITKTWTSTVGPDIGDVFTETLTDVESINRGTDDAITVVLSGTVFDSMGLFPKADDIPAIMELAATQIAGPGGAISVSLTNFATATSGVPEPSTWAMMALGFIGLGYAAVRRGSKDRSALAI
jgi:PEP-CTERM motif